MQAHAALFCLHVLSVSCIIFGYTTNIEVIPVERVYPTVLEETFVDGLKKDASRVGQPSNIVRMITRNACSGCDAMRKWLINNKIRFEEYNVNAPRNRDITADMGVGDLEFPMVYLNGRLVGGYREAMKDKEVLGVGIYGRGRA